MEHAFLASFSRVHIVGIGGIGVSGVARFCVAQGKAVSGSDIAHSALIDALTAQGITVHIGSSDAAWLADDCDLLVYSEAVPESAPERVAAAERGIRQLGHFGFMGELTKAYRTICITGTNGKSTTTAMTGKMFIDAGLDPTVFVGSLVPGWELGNVRVGKSDILIVEGDEYKKKMLALHPEMTLITNVEADHLDVYKDLADIEHAFHLLAEQTTGIVFLNVHDKDRGIACGHEEAEVHVFGEALQRATRTVSAGMQSLAVRIPLVSWLPFMRTMGTLTLRVPGEFNMMNALGALAIGDAFGIPFATMQKSLAEFAGIWRRFERVGEYSGAPVISDYAHHPTAIQGTLKAAKEFFPGKRIVALFEPHQHSRTKELFNDFVTAFTDADIVIISEIYGVAGRTQADQVVSSQDLVNAIVARGANPKTHFFTQTLTDAQEKLRTIATPNDVILIMGAGNVDSVARELIGG